MNSNLSIELVKVTEAAALAAGRWTGRGNKEEADEAATSAMRNMFNSIQMSGTVVIGEGEMDEAPMLYIGEQLGTGDGPKIDIAVDPLEGTSIVAAGSSNALTTHRSCRTGKSITCTGYVYGKNCCRACSSWEN